MFVCLDSTVGRLKQAEQLGTWGHSVYLHIHIPLYLSPAPDSALSLALSSLSIIFLAMQFREAKLFPCQFRDSMAHVSKEASRFSLRNHPALPPLQPMY